MKKKKTKTATLLVISAFAFVIIYTAAAVVLQYVTDQSISDTLTLSWFGFWGLEMGVLGTITNIKNKYHVEEEKEE